jgi:hypothetical protein
MPSRTGVGPFQINTAQHRGSQLRDRRSAIFEANPCFAMMLPLAPSGAGVELDLVKAAILDYVAK